MTDHENMSTMAGEDSLYHEHRAIFRHPVTGLRVEIIATGPSGCGKSLALDAVKKLLTRDFASRVLFPEADALDDHRP